ncbi:AIM24 family protein [Natrinema sp. 1APR25-10V2]|uniref:AIM24 family protein n=1 Tax=Natrinema sp. 1APR25-10V2 TaxID=2951081 RepID=UPI0028769750|nr:AIM24 family protein [Natrinema sp. 1APR25-10V2]MDS0476901.1 AIM24 family protein [Natrinema sp. 1APR25-10V2]
MDLQESMQSNGPVEGGDGFQKETNRFLNIPLDGRVMIKAGSMIAYTGDITFTGKSSAEGGITGFVKEAVSGEGTPIMEAEGNGHLYVAEQEKKVQVLELDQGESISVNSDDVLAFESSIDYEINTVNSISGMAAGGLINVYLTGPGELALTTHGDPLVMTPPVFTDPDATVAWSANLSPSFETNKMIEIGQTSGESIQMEFTGSDGFVVIQPNEEGSVTQSQNQ